MNTAVPDVPAPGKIIVLSGPSGVGKGTLCARLLADWPGLSLSVSLTSRPPRPGETEGRDYFFVARDTFEQRVSAGDLLEWAEYNGHYYGTPRSQTETLLGQGRHLLLEIDVQGALMVKDRLPQARLVFIEPPSTAALRERLQRRGVNSADDIERRLAIAQQELACRDRFDAVVVNDDLETCLVLLKNTLAGFGVHPVPACG